MHIRTVTLRSGKRHYTYTQIVQSYRNRKGVPTHRILGSFRDLPARDVANLKAAIDASREGKAVVVADEMAATLAGSRIRHNRRYLDLAVLLALWDDWRLGELIDELVGPQQSDVSVGRVAAALVLHRCTDPGSKLAAERWYPTTALPELWGIAPSKVNNSRIHRTLSTLEAIEEELTARVPMRIEAHQGAFVALFLDCTDTWFEGRGPDMAHDARSKEGLVRRLIGIALMCDQRGLPLRWKAFEGALREREVMTQMVTEVSSLGWVDKAPIVVDRAMGRSQAVQMLVQSGVRFLTAVTVDEFDSYTEAIPHEAFEAERLGLGLTEASHQSDYERVCLQAKRAGLVEVTPKRYLRDLGVFEKAKASPRPSSKGPAVPPGEGQAGPIAAALQLAHRMRMQLDTHTVRATADLARQHGCSHRNIQHYLSLLDLTPEVQKRVLDGEAEACGLSHLRKIAGLPPCEQAQALSQLIASRKATGRRKPHPPGLGMPSEQPVPVCLRGVVHFNPARFLNERRIAQKQLAEIEAFVADLNRRLGSEHAHRNEISVLGEVGALLTRLKLREVFEVRIDTRGTAQRPRYQVQLTRNEKAWAQQHRYDGFNLFVGHPDLPHTAAEICDLYFAKDQVEKDFRVIKSELELRPIHHRTDEKVRAHVTLCVLALLLERTLEQRLHKVGIPHSAAHCLDLLRPCHLNELRAEWGPTYTVTELDPDQNALLRALSLDALANDQLVAERITPR